MRPTIVHISNDYPDPLAPNKTPAVLRLVEGTPEFRHVVYSLNRVRGWSGIREVRPFGEDRTAIAYHALPFGLFWETPLRNVADWITADLKKNGIQPDIIEAHKFTVEGRIGLQLSKTFGKPLVCDIQGDTDAKILNARPDLRSLYREIAQRAALIFPYSHWPLPDFRTLVGLDESKCRMLPVVPGMDNPTPARAVGHNRLLTVFHLDSWKRKNILGMIAGMKELVAERPDIHLDVYGGGKEESISEVQQAIDAAGLASHVTLKGKIDNNALPTVMKDYAAFLLPSLRETFGLVFAEALLTGMPVLYPKDQAIHGYFNPAAIGYACDPKDPRDIAKGINHLLNNEAPLKQSIATLQSTGGLDQIRRHNVLDTYRTGIKQVLQ